MNRLVLAATVVALVASATSSSAQNLQQYYPERALRSSVGGKATAQCDVTSDGRLINCQILAEEPKGYSFGIATVRLFEAEVSIKVTPEVAAGGQTFRRTVVWKPFQETPPPVSAAPAAP